MIVAYLDAKFNTVFSTAFSVGESVVQVRWECPCIYDSIRNTFMVCRIKKKLLRGGGGGGGGGEHCQVSIG